MRRSVRKYERGTKVVHFALQTQSTVSYCSFISKIHTPLGSHFAEDAYIVNLDIRPLPDDTPVTCIACLAEAGEVP